MEKTDGTIGRCPSADASAEASANRWIGRPLGIGMEEQGHEAEKCHRLERADEFDL